MKMKKSLNQLFSRRFVVLALLVLACSTNDTLRSHSVAILDLIVESTPTDHERRRAENLIEERAEAIAAARKSAADIESRLMVTEDELAEIDSTVERLVARIALVHEALSEGSTTESHFVIAGGRYPRTTLVKDAETMAADVERLEARGTIVEDAAHMLSATLNETREIIANAEQEFEELTIRSEEANLRLAQRELLDELTGGGDLLPGISSGELERTIEELERRAGEDRGYGVGTSGRGAAATSPVAIDFSGRSQKRDVASPSIDLDRFLEQRSGYRSSAQANRKTKAKADSDDTETDYEVTPKTVAPKTVAPKAKRSEADASACRSSSCPTSRSYRRPVGTRSYASYYPAARGGYRSCR